MTGRRPAARATPRGNAAPIVRVVRRGLGVAAALAVSAWPVLARAQRVAEPTPVATLYERIGRSDTVTIAGRVTLGYGVTQARALDIGVADGTGGIRVFMRAALPEVREGDSVVARGVVQRYRGSAELLATEVRAVAAPPRVVAPLALARPEAVNHVEGALVRVRGVVRAAGWSEGGRWFELRAPDEESRAVRASDPEPLKLWIPASHRDHPALTDFDVGDRLDVTGVVWAYRDNPADPVVWQVVPRGAADVRVLGVPRGWYAAGRRVFAALIVCGALAFAIARFLTRRAARALRETEARYAQLLALSPAPVLVHDGRQVLFANAAAARLLTSRTEAEMSGRPVAAFEHREAPGALLVAAGAAGDAPPAATLRTKLCADGGRTLNVEATKSACRYNDRPAAVVLLRDIDDELRRESQLRAIADLDELTGVANRRGFLARATAALDTAWRTGRTATLVFADVDGLKQINDAHGHAAGDAAIRAVAGALTRVVGGSDVVARLSGDEFVALTLDPDPAIVSVLDEAAAATGVEIGGVPTADAVLADFEEALREEAERSGAPCEVSASVGLCQVHDDGTTLPAAALAAAIARADAELYRRKGSRTPGRVATAHDGRA